MNTKHVVMLTLIVLGGCASRYDRYHPYEQAWRIGQVEEVGGATTRFPITGFDCRPRTGVPKSGGARYAYLRFEVAGGTKYINSIPKQRHVIVAVPDGLDVREGEWVYVNIRDCSQRLERPSL